MLSASAELARRVLDAAPDAMIVVDSTGVIRFANRQVSVLFGFEHDDVVGRSVEDLIPEQYRGKHHVHRQAFGQAPQLRLMGERLPLLGQRRDGSTFPVEISLSPIPDGDRKLVAASIRDVTERKRVEHELQLARESADRAREAGDQLRTLADRANQAKGRFLATASHDLRQPLQTLALLIGALRRTVTEADAIEALAQQEQAVGAMSRLLNALLDISKLESGAVKPAVADFRIMGLFEAVRREFGPLAHSKGIELKVDGCTESVHSDPGLLEQVVRNLVSNAIKYTRTGYVQLRATRERTALRVDVLDTGIGIPAEQIALIFDEFYQVGVPTNSSRDGYGLGLSIVQRLAKLMDLRLEVKSELGRGSVFSVLVPLAHDNGAPAAPPPGPSAAPEPRVAKLRVLLVEDDASVRNATRMLLRVEGYQVTAVPSLAEALSSVDADGPPDILITDYHLRDGELGTHVIATLRQRVGADLKVVLVTGDTSAAVKALGGDPHLRLANKPVNAEELLALLESLGAS